MKKNWNLPALLLVLAMLVAVFSGCGGSAAPAADSTAAEASAVSEAEAPAESEAEEPAEAEDSAEEPEEAAPGTLEFVELPIVEDEVHYSCWMPVAPFMDLIGVSLDDFSNQINMVRVINETTNVYIDFQAVAGGFGEDEKFNLMIAANDYCDIIGISSNYSTGTEGAIDDEVIIDIRDDLETYAPNYMTLLKANQKAYLNMLTDSGQMGCIAQLLKKAGTENMGMIIRKDWLDEAGLTGEPLWTRWRPISSTPRTAMAPMPICSTAARTPTGPLPST